MNTHHHTHWLLASLLLISACQQSATPAVEAQVDASQSSVTESNATASTPGEASATPGVVTLTTEQIEKIGITTTPASAISSHTAINGYAVVLSREAIAQVVADVEVARAAAQQSDALLARTQRLAGTPGAFATENLENAQHQATANRATLDLAQSKLNATLGAALPWRGEERSKILSEIAHGDAKLVRATFALGSLSTTPTTLQLSRFDSSEPSWKVMNIWPAPADANTPGRSFMGVLRTGDASEGERLQASAPAGKALSGILVPASAVVLSDQRYWCYVQRAAGTFARVAIDILVPVTDGYAVTQDIKAGDAIVTSGAALLLARETNPATEAE